MTDMNINAYAMAEMNTSRIWSDAQSIALACQNIGFWIDRLRAAPDWETSLEAELDEAELRLNRAIAQVQRARAVIASLRTQTLIAAE